MARFLCGAGLMIAALAITSAAHAQTTIKQDTIKPTADVTGAATYKAYCAVCHGTTGTGDGPAAKALVKPPTDLTTIAQRSKGKFPAGAVRMTVAGDTVVAAHGSRDMPMWGPLFKSVDSSSVAELRLRNLIGYLETLQK